MGKFSKIYGAIGLGLLALPAVAEAAGKFAKADYQRALWMTTRFYGGQRSGVGPNWLLMDHTFKTSFTTDADGSVKLDGGWFDCGDHVTFGQTFFYSAYMLARAYDAFPTGFPDLYDGTNYADYKASGNWDMAGGKPNGVPDLLEELKYATDWIIKAAPNATTFYSQKGNGDYDHTNWVTAGKMSTLPLTQGGGLRPITKNPSDGVMAGMASATLAVMARVYKKYDPEYAALCKKHAEFAYAYAKTNKGKSVGAGSFYGSHAKPTIAFIIASSEMYALTGEATYKTAAAAERSQIVWHGWGFDYSNTHDLGAYTLGALTGDVTGLATLKSTFLKEYTASVNSEGVCTKGNSGWGALRYPANHAFMAALYAKAKTDATYDAFIYNQVDYILGANTAGQSFVVGFCSSCKKQPLHPHHRNVYLNDANPTDALKQTLVIPTRNKQFGSLVGGKWTSASFNDNVNSYADTEGGIDYNAGLVGVLGYINSIVNPVDTAKLTGKPVSLTPKSTLSSGLQVLVGDREVQFALGTQQNATLQVHSAQGALVWTGNVQEGKARWVPEGQGSGVFFATTQSGANTLARQAFVLR